MSVTTERDGKFQLSYKTTDGTESAVRLHPEATDLFSAAPELLEAARLAANILSLLGEEVGALGLNAKNVPEKLRAAITKATGGQS